MNNGVDKNVCTFPETETRSISSYSSRCYGETAEDNTLLSSDTCSATSCSSDSCGGGGFSNAGLDSDLEGEAARVLEAVLRQPACSALRISSSQVRVGPSLTYNGPVTINVTMQPQAEAKTTPRASDAPAETPLEPQTVIPQLSQQQRMVSVVQIRSQVEMEVPVQQQPVSPPPTLHQNPQQQPIFAKLVEPSPHLQQPLWKPAKQPRTMLQRNIQTAYAQDFRVVKPVGCQRIAAELARKHTRTEPQVDGAEAASCCEQHLAVVVLLIMIACLLAIALTLFVRSSPRPADQRTTPLPQPQGTTQNDRKTEKSQESKCRWVPNLNAHKQDGKNCSAATSKTADPPKGGLETGVASVEPSTTPIMPTSPPHLGISEQPASVRSATTAKCKCHH